MPSGRPRCGESILHHRYSIDSEGYGEIHTGCTTLDKVPASMTMSVYCRCGKIVVLDRAEMVLKLKLDKELECMECRNSRICREIDEMNNHYLGISEEDVYSERSDPLYNIRQNNTNIDISVTVSRLARRPSSRPSS